MENTKDFSVVQSIVRATSVLDSLADGLEKLSDISNRLNLSHSTTHRLLKTLEKLDLVAQDIKTGRYYLGPKIISLASNPSISHKQLIAYSFEEMKHLRQFSGESVALQVITGTQRVLLEELTSTQHISYSLGKGFVAPLHIGTGGLVLLSELSENDRDMILNSTKLFTMIGNKPIDKEALIEEINRVKKQGYSITYDQTILGAGGISVPIKNYACPAALSIFGPKERFKKNIVAIKKEIIKSANRISGRFLDK